MRAEVAIPVLFTTCGLFLAGLGVPLAARRVRPNRLYGLRTATTLADPGVWYPANAALGYGLIGAGGGLLALFWGTGPAPGLGLEHRALIAGGWAVVASVGLCVGGSLYARRLARRRAAAG